jgi:hypothetical protein
VFSEECRKSGAEFFTIECIFGEQQSFDLDPAPNVIQLRASSVLWQKERLINHLVGSFIPDSYSKIAWADCDLIFEKPTGSQKLPKCSITIESSSSSSWWTDFLGVVESVIRSVIDPEVLPVYGTIRR